MSDESRSSFADESASTDPLAGPYASWARRCSGFFLDILPALLLSSWANADYYNVAGFGADQDWANGQNYLVEVSGPGWMYYALHALAIVYWFANKGVLEGATGKSWAKHVLGMQTVDATATSGAQPSPIGAWRGIARAFLVYVEFVSIVVCGLGLILWLWPLWQPRIQALLSDRALDVVVLRR
jgi:hypothetical protein